MTLKVHIMEWVMVSLWTAAMVSLVLFPPLTLVVAATFTIVRPQRSRAIFLCFAVPTALIVIAFFIWAETVGFFRLSAEVPIIWSGVFGAVMGAAASVAAAAYIVRAIRYYFDKSRP